MRSAVAERDQPAVARCTRCGTELAPALLSCPACRALVHADRLKQLAAMAEERGASGHFEVARDLWQRALPLLPPTTEQHAMVAERIASASAGLRFWARTR